MAKRRSRQMGDLGEGKGILEHVAPLAGGMLAACLLALTLLAAVVLGMEEQKLASVATRSPTATAIATAMVVVTPTATLPMPTLSPSPTEALPTLPPTPSPLPPSATPQPTVKVQCVPPSNWRIYTVQRGETLSGLAWRYWTTPKSLVEANCLKRYAVSAGQRIYVPNVAPRQSCGRPSGWVAYLIQRGDTLSSIARRVGSTVSALMQANCLKSDRILAGATLWVPYLPSAPSVPKARPTATRRPTRTPAPKPTDGTPTDEPSATSTSKPPTTVEPTNTPRSTDRPDPTATPKPPEPTQPPTSPPPTSPPEPTLPPPTSPPRPTSPPPTSPPEPTEDAGAFPPAAAGRPVVAWALVLADR